MVPNARSKEQTRINRDRRLSRRWRAEGGPCGGRRAGSRRWMGDAECVAFTKARVAAPPSICTKAVPVPAPHRTAIPGCHAQSGSSKRPAREKCCACPHATLLLSACHHALWQVPSLILGATAEPKRCFARGFFGIGVVSCHPRGAACSRP